eukprot:6791341-Pyramimonas_sp.AAC.1
MNFGPYSSRTACGTVVTGHDRSWQQQPQGQRVSIDAGLHASYSCDGAVSPRQPQDLAAPTGSQR